MRRHSSSTRARRPSWTWEGSPVGVIESSRRRSARRRAGLRGIGAGSVFIAADRRYCASDYLSPVCVRVGLGYFNIIYV